MKQKPLHRPLPIKDRAREIIFSQRGVLMSVRRTAWWLFQYQLTRTDPVTGKLHTPRKALRAVLDWMVEQVEVLERVKQEPTQMQRHILQMLAEGKAEKRIAYELGRSAHTISVHIARLRSRLGVETKSQVMIIAGAKGWVVVRRSSPEDRTAKKKKGN